MVVAALLYLNLLLVLLSKIGNSDIFYSKIAFSFCSKYEAYQEFILIYILNVIKHLLVPFNTRKLPKMYYYKLGRE